MTTANGIRIEPLGLEHITQVYELLRRSGWIDASLPSRLTLKKAIDEGTAFVAVSTSDFDEFYGPYVAGCVRFISDGQLVMYITEIAVDRSYRGRGVGRALLDACVARFPTARIDLLATESAREFYEHVGFIAKPGYRRWPQ